MRFQNSTRVLAGLIASAALPSISMALPLTDPTISKFRWYGDTPWTGSSSPGTFVRAAGGDFNGDGAKDVFLLVDGRPVFFYIPAAWDALNITGNVSQEEVNDIATSPREDGSGDDLVYVDKDGLHRASWNPGFTTTQISVEGSEWAENQNGTLHTGATRLRAADLDDNGYVDCVGIKEGGRTILVRRVGLDQGVVVGHTTSFTFPWDVYDIDILQWDGGSEREIVILDDYGVEVFTPDGLRINRYPRPTTKDAGDAIAVFRKSGYDYDRIAWARMLPSPSETQQELVELAWALPLLYSLPTDITFDDGDHVTAMVAADACPVQGLPDGNYELLVQHQASHDPILFKGIQGPSGKEAETATFSMSESESLESNVEADPEYTPASSVAGYSGMPAPLFEDLSGDGVPDVFLHVQDVSTTDRIPSLFQFWRGESDLEESESVSSFGSEGPVTRLRIFETSVPDGANTYTPHYYPDDQYPETGQRWVPDVTGEMYLRLNVPHNTAANRLEIVVWKRSAGSATLPLAYDEEFHRILFPLHDAATSTTWTGANALGVDIPMNFVLNGSGPDYEPCQEAVPPGCDPKLDDCLREKEFWLGIHLSHYTDNAPAGVGVEDTLVQVGEQWIIVFAATKQNGEDLFILGFSDGAQMPVCNFPGCRNEGLPNTAEVENCASQLGGIILSGTDTPRRRFAPTENRIRPAPPASWVDIL